MKRSSCDLFFNKANEFCKEKGQYCFIIFIMDNEIVIFLFQKLFVNFHYRAKINYEMEKSFDLFCCLTCTLKGNELKKASTVI